MNPGIMDQLQACNSVLSAPRGKCRTPIQFAICHNLHEKYPSATPPVSYRPEFHQNFNTTGNNDEMW
jgi:hypothetical protein